MTWIIIFIIIISFIIGNEISKLERKIDDIENRLNDLELSDNDNFNDEELDVNVEEENNT